MRKTFTIAILVIMVWGCAKKMAPSKAILPSSNNVSVNSPNVVLPESTTNTPTPVNQPAVATVSGTNNTKTLVKMGTQSPEVLSQIAGQATFNAKCGRCHQLKVTTNYTRDRWAAVMAVMSNSTHANLSDMERENVLAYVQANSQK